MVGGDQRTQDGGVEIDQAVKGLVEIAAAKLLQIVLGCGLQLGFGMSGHRFPFTRTVGKPQGSRASP